MTQAKEKEGMAGKGIETAGSFVALMYHNVAPDGGAYPDVSAAATSYFVGRSIFAAQLKVLAENGRCMEWRELSRFYEEGAAGKSKRAEEKKPAILLTFDDGWSDAVQQGGDLLKERGWQAVIFVTTDFIGKKHFLSRAELAGLDAETFPIGSHARSHRMLSLMEEGEIRAELSESKKVLEDIVGREVESISIPNGAVDARVRRIAAECGYRLVFDSEVRLNRRGDDRLAIGRVSVKEHTSMDVFRGYVRHRILRERMRRAVLSAPKRLLGLRRYDRLRRGLLGGGGKT